MTTALERFRDSAALRKIARYGESATKKRTTTTVVNGRTTPGTPTESTVHLAITSRSGDLVEQGWGRTATGDFMAVVDIADDYAEGDLVVPDEGTWAGYVFRVTFVDRQGSLVALERVHAGNA